MTHAVTHLHLSNIQKDTYDFQVHPLGHKHLFNTQGYDVESDFEQM